MRISVTCHVLKVALSGVTNHLEMAQPPVFGALVPA
jgi:hypothetical protein